MPIIKRKFTKLLGGAVLIGVAGLCLASSDPKLGVPEGFGSGTTGGADGTDVVTVTSASQLKNALCSSFGSDGLCSDTSPRIIKIQGTIDFTASEGKTSGTGCDYGQSCQTPYITERLVLLNSSDTHCGGKSTYSIAYDKAGVDPLLVGSNKTVIGVGSDATLKGRGLRLVNVSNVVVRNMTISDINEGIIFAGDAIALDNVNRIWIDHNRFQRIGRQFIAGGNGPVTSTTISWNDFNGNSSYSYYCNGTHYWNVLLEGSTQTVTLSNNWFRSFSGRAPILTGNSALHIVNNYYQDGYWHALDAYDPSKALIEGNYYENVNTPVTSTGTGYVFGTLGGPNTATQSLCHTYLKRNCLGNMADPAPQVNAFQQVPGVVEEFSTLNLSITVPYKASSVPAVVKAGAGPGNI